MAWTDVKTSADYVESSDYNDHVTETVRISSQLGIISLSGESYSIITASGSKYTNSYIWFTESSNKLSYIMASGDEYSAAYGYIINSGSQLADLLISGEKYTDAYLEYNASANLYSNWLASGEKLSRWYKESSQKLGEYVASGDEYSNAHASAQIAIYEIDWNTPTASSGLSLSDTGMVSGNLTLYISDYIASTTAIETFYPSSLGKQISSQVQLIGDLSGSSISRYYPSDMGKNISSQVLDLFNFSSVSVGYYYPSAIGVNISTQVTDLYLFSSASVGYFYPSTLGVNISAQVADLYSASGAFGLISGAYTGFSSNSVGMYYPSTLGKGISSQVHAIGDLSGSAIGLYFPSTLGKGVSGAVLPLTNWYSESSQKLSSVRPMMFNIANVLLYSGQNVHLTRFKCPTGKKAYVYQATACASGGIPVSGLCIEILSGNTQLNTWASIYSTSSNVVQQGYPLASSDIDSNIEIRFMYSGTHEYGSQASISECGTAFMDISVY
jgi:hypothetical protein